MTSAYISHAGIDAEAARELQARLAAIDVHAVLASDVSDGLPGRMVDAAQVAIQNSDFVFVICSSAAERSRFVDAEVALATSLRGVRVVPVLIDNNARPLRRLRHLVPLRLFEGDAHSELLRVVKWEPRRESSRRRSFLPLSLASASIAATAVIAAYLTKSLPPHQRQPPTAPFAPMAPIEAPAFPLDNLVKKVASDCATQPSGQDTVAIGFHASTIYDVAAPENISRTCLQRRLQSQLSRRTAVEATTALASLNGVQLFSVNWEHDDLPRLPYPLPHPSGRLTLLNPINEVTQRALAQKLANSLERAGYANRLTWYGFLDGFVVVTAPEKVTIAGKPLFGEDGDRRFSRDTDFAPTSALDMLTWWAKRLFVTQQGHYQFFMFICASGEITEDEVRLPLEPLLKEASSTTRNVPVGERLLDESMSLSGFVYVFGRASKDDDARLVAPVMFIDRQREARIDL